MEYLHPCGYAWGGYEPDFVLTSARPSRRYSSDFCSGIFTLGWDYEGTGKITDGLMRRPYTGPVACKGSSPRPLTQTASMPGWAEKQPCLLYGDLAEPSAQSEFVWCVLKPGRDPAGRDLATGS